MTATNNTVKLFPLTETEISTEMSDGLYLFYQLDRDRLPCAICSKLVQMAIENEDYTVPAQWVVNMLAALNGKYALMLNPYNVDDAALCVYVEGMDVFSSVDVRLNQREKCYINGLLSGMGER